MSEADKLAEYTVIAYRRMIRTYRNPSIAPELNLLMDKLRDADAYFREIPGDELTPEQRRIWKRVKNILMRD